MDFIRGMSLSTRGSCSVPSSTNIVALPTISFDATELHFLHTLSFCSVLHTLHLLTKLDLFMKTHTE